MTVRNQKPATQHDRDPLAVARLATPAALPAYAIELSHEEILADLVWPHQLPGQWEFAPRVVSARPEAQPRAARAA